MNIKEASEELRYILEYTEELQQQISTLKQKIDFPDTAKDKSKATCVVSPSSLTTRQAAKLAGKSESTIRRWSKECELGHRIGGQWRIDREVFEEFLKSWVFCMFCVFWRVTKDPVNAIFVDMKNMNGSLQ